MARKHWHRGNGSAGCLFDSMEVYTRKRDAIEWAETLFGDSLCDDCYADMRKAICSRGFDGTYYFDRTCENETPMGGMCFAGADVLEISSCTEAGCEDQE